MKLNLTALAENLQEGTRETLGKLGFTEGKDGVPVTATPSDVLTVEYDGKTLKIGYPALNQYYRALRLVKQNGCAPFSVREECAVKELGIMADCSRNAVRNLPYLKRLIRDLALMGYNQLQLYTEDTYEIPEEPYFGYMRGRYTAEELKETVRYAALFGVEVVPCIQTLAHLNQIFRWQNEYREVNDVGDILLIGEEKTYELIERMISACRNCFTSDKIHIGMDEAHLVGRGAYEDKHGGVTDRHGLFKQHLKRVIEICEKYGFRPMMWSDMFFRLAFNGEYYPEVGTEIDESVLEGVPAGLRLVYWDYYHTEYDHYEYMIRMHQKFGTEVSFAGGAWRWAGFTGFNDYSFRSMRPAIDACRATGLDKFFLTMWGDNGAECSDLALLPTLVMSAERLYGHEDYAPAFKALTGMEANDFLTLDLPNQPLGKISEDVDCSSKYMLYNDCLGGILDCCVEGGESDYYRRHAQTIAAAEEKAGEYAYLFATQRTLCEVLSLKYELGAVVRKAYGKKDKTELKRIATTVYPQLLEKLDAFYAAFEKQWYFENKPFGFEVQDYRIGGLIHRVKHCASRLIDYADGKLDTLPELDEKLLTDKGRFRNLNGFSLCIGTNIL